MRLRAAPDIPPLQADSAVSPSRNPLSSRRAQSLRLDAAAGAGDDDAATWEWSRPIPADAGDVTLKLRRRLYGPHADAASVCPDPSLDEGAAGGEPIDAEQLLHRRGGVSPAQVRESSLQLVGHLPTCTGSPPSSSSSSSQHCWLRAQMASQDATTFLTLMPHPLLLPQEKRTVAVRISNACSIDALWVRQVRMAGKEQAGLWVRQVKMGGKEQAGLWVHQVRSGEDALAAATSANWSAPSLCPLCPLRAMQKGFGPAIAEVVPCAGGFRPAEVPFLLDNPGAVGAKTLAIRAHPVGVAALMYWDGGALGYDVKRERWRDAADRLVGCALAGEYQAARLSLAPIHPYMHAHGLPAGEYGLASVQGDASETFGRLLSVCDNGSHLHHLTAHKAGGEHGERGSRVHIPVIGIPRAACRVRRHVGRRPPRGRRCRVRRRRLHGQGEARRDPPPSVAPPSRLASGCLSR